MQSSAAFRQGDLLILQLPISIATQGDTELIPGKSGIRPVVTRLLLFADADVEVYFKSSAGTELLGGETAPLPLEEVRAVDLQTRARCSVEV